ACRYASASRFVLFGEEEVAQSFDVLNLAAQFLFAAQALRGLDQEFFEKFVHQGIHAPAVAGRQMIHAIQAGADEGGTLFSDTRTQRIDEADELDAGLPGEKFADVLFDDAFGAGDFAFAGVTILLDDFGEVVNVVDVEVVEIRGRGIDVARNAETTHKES